MTPPGESPLLGFALSWVDREGSNLRGDDALWLHLRPELVIERAVCVRAPDPQLDARLRALRADVMIVDRRALDEVLAGDARTTVLHVSRRAVRTVLRDDEAVAAIARFVRAGGSVHLASGRGNRAIIETLEIRDVIALVPVEEAHEIAEGNDTSDGPSALLLPVPVTRGEGVELQAVPASSLRASAHGGVLITSCGVRPRVPPEWITRAASREGVGLAHDRWTVRPARGYMSQKIVFGARRAGEGSPVVIKATQAPSFNPLLENEACSLHGLDRDMRGFRPPTVLFSTIEGGLRVVGESRVSGRSLGPDATQDEQRLAMQALTELAVSSRHEVGATEAADALAQLLDHHAELNGPPPGEHVFLAEEIDRIAASGTSFPTVFMHGDSSAFNLFLTDDGALSAVDFERSERRGMPLWDLFYFTAAMGGARTATLRHEGVLAYAEATQLDPDVIVPLFCLHQMWLAMRETSRRPVNDRRRGRNGRALADLVRAGRQAAERLALGS